MFDKETREREKTAINLERKKWRNFSSFNLLIYRLSVRFVCTSALENSEHTKSHREIKSGRDLTRCCATKRKKVVEKEIGKEKKQRSTKKPRKMCLQNISLADYYCCSRCCSNTQRL